MSALSHTAALTAWVLTQVATAWDLDHVELLEMRRENTSRPYGMVSLAISIEQDMGALVTTVQRHTYSCWLVDNVSPGESVFDAKLTKANALITLLMGDANPTSDTFLPQIREVLLSESEPFQGQWAIGIVFDVLVEVDTLT